MIYLFVVKRVNRSIFVWTLLLLLLAPTGWTLWTRLQQSAIRHRMEERLEATLLQEYLISKGQLRWVRLGKELLLEGKLFDVKRIENVPDGRLKICGLFDEEEQALTKLIRERQEERQKQQHTHLIHLLQMPQALDTLHFTTERPVRRHRNDRAGGSSDPLSDGIRRVPTPPPQG
ncbi:MAG: hypothetical protein RJA57_1601 [Bacteroidota bacterium]|jgi:hypothetical protein